MAISMTAADGVAEVLIDSPPVNALTVRDWFDLADAVTTAGRDPGTAAVILMAAKRALFGDRLDAELRLPGEAPTQARLAEVSAQYFGPAGAAVSALAQLCSTLELPDMTSTV